MAKRQPSTESHDPDLGLCRWSAHPLTTDKACPAKATGRDLLCDEHREATEAVAEALGDLGWTCEACKNDTQQGAFYGGRMVCPDCRVVQTLEGRDSFQCKAEGEKGRGTGGHHP